MKGLTRIGCAALASAALVLGLTPPAAAGVSARRQERERDGRARVALVDRDRGIEHVWDSFETDALPLNPNGAAYGDLFPSLVESNVAPYHPWVVWSRFNGKDYDLVWSRWRGDSWKPIRLLGGNSVHGDDVDPVLQFDPEGRPYVVWWTDQKGTGTVYLSVFRETTWSPAVRVSLRGMDSRYPTLELPGKDRLVLHYDTPRGPVTRFGVLSSPATITDDINPLISLRWSQLTVPGGKGQPGDGYRRP